MDDKDAELARLRRENEELRRKEAALRRKKEALERLTGMRSNPGTSPGRAAGARRVQCGDVEYDLPEGADPEEHRRLWEGVKAMLDAERQPEPGHQEQGHNAGDGNG